MKIIKVLRVTVCLIVIILSSFYLLNDDLYKFFISGQSSTYNVSLVKNSPLLVFPLAIAVILLTILSYRKDNKVIKIALMCSVIFWLASLRNYAFVEGNGISIVAGVSIIPVKSVDLIEFNRIDLSFGDIFLGKKLEKRIMKLQEKRSSPHPN